jgi:predicted RNase H-like nuclease
MTVCAGADGCKGGWIAVWRDAGQPPQTGLFPDFHALASALPPPAVIAVDMPIGLPDFIHGPGRGPEQAVRPKLGMRQSSVFSVPSRAAVYAECGPLNGQAAVIAAHRRANGIAFSTSNPARRISIQAFMLFPKIREIDAFLRADGREAGRIIESHPEYAFTVLNGGKAMALPKKIKGRVNSPGMDERRNLLAHHGIPAPFLAQSPPKGAAADDFLDACAMLLIADHHSAGLARPYPEPLLRDSFGLPIAIWA